jgi:tellurite methyltransferase
LTRETSWLDYYRDNADRPPREMLIEILDRFGPEPREAIDFGCGQGIDTIAMLKRGWWVLAVDAEREGIRRLLDRAPAGARGRLSTKVARMEDVELPAADLVWAGFSLFFVPPERFQDVWRSIGAAVRGSGRFAGQLLGDRDTWAGEEGISSFTRAEAERLFDGWTLESFEEEEEDGDACSGPKHWHVFHVVASAPA